MAYFKRKSKNDKMKWYLIIAGVACAVYYGLFNTTYGTAMVSSVKGLFTAKTTAA